MAIFVEASIPTKWSLCWSWTSAKRKPMADGSVLHNVACTGVDGGATVRTYALKGGSGASLCLAHQMDRSGSVQGKLASRPSRRGGQAHRGTWREKHRKLADDGPIRPARCGGSP